MSPILAVRSYDKSTFVAKCRLVAKTVIIILNLQNSFAYKVQCETDRDLMDRGFHIRRFTNDEIRSWHSQNRLEEEVKSLFSGYLNQAKNKSVA